MCPTAFDNVYPEKQVRTLYRKTIAAGAEYYDLPKDFRKDVGIVFVSHAMPDAIIAMEEIESGVGHIAAVIPKTTKILYPDQIERWKKNWTVYDDLDRAKLDKSGVMEAFLEATLAPYRWRIVVDHSSYITHNLHKLTGQFNIHGCVDSTTDGYWKYSRSKRPGVPYINNWNTPVKYWENDGVAIDDVLGINLALSEIGLPGFQRIKNIGIIGLGGTGRPLPTYLKHAAAILGIEFNITAYEKSEYVLALRGQYGIPRQIEPDHILDPSDKKALFKIVSENDLVISTTGDTPLKKRHIKQARDGLLWTGLAPASSELGLPSLLKNKGLVRAPEERQLSLKKIPGTPVPWTQTYLTETDTEFHTLGEFPLNYKVHVQNPIIAATNTLKILSIISIVGGQKPPNTQRYGDTSLPEHVIELAVPFIFTYVRDQNWQTERFNYTLRRDSGLVPTLE